MIQIMSTIFTHQIFLNVFFLLFFSAEETVKNKRNQSLSSVVGNHGIQGPCLHGANLEEAEKEGKYMHETKYIK